VRDARSGKLALVEKGKAAGRSGLLGPGARAEEVVVVVVVVVEYVVGWSCAAA
jgi:hypothetical protein